MDELKDLGCEKIVIKKISGVSKQRQELEVALSL
jgi:hypothetical protein